MDPIVYIEYEVIDPVSNVRFFTKSRQEALAHFEKECTVFERYTTVNRHSTHEESKFILTDWWNKNPNFKGE